MVKYPNGRGVMRLLACMLIVLLALTGCAAESDAPDLTSKDEPTRITLTPVDPFKGEGEKFKLFLGDMSGAFKLRYEGSRPHTSLDIDIWKDGKKVGSAGSIMDLFFDSNERKSDEVEVMISIDKISIESQDDDLYKIKVSTGYEDGTNLFTFSTSWDKDLNTRGVIDYQEPTTFTTKESVHVWGMQSTSTHKIQVLDFSPESLSSIEQALIFTLRFED